MPRLFALLALLASPAALAQAPERVWIVVDGSALAPVADGASEAALARRALRGSGRAPVARALTAEARADLDALGVRVAVESRWLGAVSADLDARQRAAVAALPYVREVRPVETLVAAARPSLAPWATPAEASPVRLDYGLSAAQLAFVKADVLLEQGLTGRGVRVGYLDTLYDFAHPALAPIPADGRLIAVRDFIGGTQRNFHGLATSSIALGRADGALVGPAYGAEVMAATTEFAPTETHAEEDTFVAALEWMEASGVDVVNISLGYSQFDAGQGDYTYADLDGDTALVTRAADRAVSLGVVVVTSAGNEGASAWRYVTAPADADSVITVGAATLTGARASFSSFGPTADGRTKPDVSALGETVYVATPGGGYKFGDGTSYSAPMVAGVVAQLLQANPSLTPVEVRERLRETASQASAPDNALGWGIVDAAAALQRATSTLPALAAGRWRLYPSVVRTGGAVAVETFDPTALDVFDVTGRRVASYAAGLPWRRVTVDGLPAGIYFVRAVDVPSLPALRLVVVR